MEIQKRDKWENPRDFIFSCIGMAVGLGNIWRFPYLCFKNGGGSFFIPYIVMLVFGGIPVFILEVALGQFMSKGGLHAWDICPLFKGIGVATNVIVFLMNIYYIMVMAWSAFYFVMSLTSTLPWSHCNNAWNTKRCFSENDVQSFNKTNTTFFFNATTDSSVEFWERRVLQITDGVEDGGGLVWELVLCLFFVWTIVYFCVWKGPKWSIKIIYFTTLCPYVMLTILLIRAVTLDGAAMGITYYLKPDFSRLSEAKVWVDGGTQVFFSYAIALGCMISIGSCNTFNNNFFRQCCIVAAVNSGTSVFGGFVVFSVLGFMAKQQNSDLINVAEAGPGLAFIAYPKGVAQMPFAPFWSAMFFFTLFLVGIDSQIVAVDVFVGNVIDSLPERFFREKYKMLFSLVYCVISFLFGLCMVSRGGMYIFQLFDYYSASGMVLLYICFLECIAIGWIFGADKFIDVIEMMIGQRLNIVWYFCWKIITPLLTMGILVFQIMTFTPLTYNKTYIYPEWAQAFGLFLALASMSCVPLYALYIICLENGNFVQRCRNAIVPKLKPSQIPEKWKQTEMNISYSELTCSPVGESVAERLFV